jgi:hypothetical protein
MWYKINNSHQEEPVMKKLLIIVLAVGLLAAVSIGAYAHGGGRKNYGRGMYGGPMMGWGHGSGPMMGGRGVRGGYGYCGGYSPTQRGWSGWNAPGQTDTTSQLITEAQARESAEAYINQYLPGYTIEKVAKDEWRPMYAVTLKSDNGAEQQMWIRGFDGQVMHVIPKTAE